MYKVPGHSSKHPSRRITPATGGDITKFEEFVHRMSPSAMVPDVYVVDKVVDMRIKQGEVEYRGSGRVTLGSTTLGSLRHTCLTMVHRNQWHSIVLSIQTKWGAWC